MKTIEEEIKQKKFPDIFVKTDVNLLFTSGWLQNVKSRFFKPFGLTQQQYNVLRILRGQYPKSIKLAQITQRMIDKMSNASRLVDKLQQKELVSQIQNPTNKREVSISITEKGLELLKEIDIELAKTIPPIQYKNVSVEELEQLNLILDKIRS